MSNPPDLQISYEADVLIVRANGRYLIENVEAAILRISAAIEQQPVKAALFDFRGIAGSISFLDRYELGKFVGRHLRSVPLGALAREDQLDKERLALVVARNRGATVELFREPCEVQAWLASLPSLNNAPQGLDPRGAPAHPTPIGRPSPDARGSAGHHFAE